MKLVLFVVVVVLGLFVLGQPVGGKYTSPKERQRVFLEIRCERTTVPSLPSGLSLSRVHPRVSFSGEAFQSDLWLELLTKRGGVAKNYILMYSRGGSYEAVFDGWYGSIRGNVPQAVWASGTAYTIKAWHAPYTEDVPKFEGAASYQLGFATPACG